MAFAGRGMLDTDRRAMMLTAVLGTVAAGAATSSAEARSGRGVQIPSLETQMRQAIAARAVENVINRYEVLLGESYVSRAYALFSKAPDVQADVGFGMYYGPAGMQTLFLKLHGKLVGDADNGTARPGAFYVLENTTGVVEVAQDLKTARGLWYGAAFSTPGDANKGFSARYGMARRAVDFIYEDGEWKIWHYFVYGMLYAPLGKSYTDPAVVAENAAHDFTFPGDLAPQAPSAIGIGPKYTWRPDTALKGVLPPEPYRTFSESESYALHR